MVNKLDSIVDSLYGATSSALVFDDNAWNERKIHLEQTPSLKRRLALLAIHHVSRVNPDFIKKHLTLDYARAGYEVIGIGRSSTVINMHGKAVKIIRSTSNMSSEQREGEKSKLEFSQKILLSRMAEYALVQSFEVIEHPIKPGEVLAAKQDFIDDFEPIEINNLDVLTNLDPEQKTQFKRFTRDALSMAQETGWSPDILGASNLGFKKGSNDLILVDTIPSKSDGSRKSTIRYLERILQQ